MSFKVSVSHSKDKDSQDSESTFSGLEPLSTRQNLLLVLGIMSLSKMGLISQKMGEITLKLLLRRK